MATDPCTELPVLPLARILGLSERTAYRLAEAGVLVRTAKGRYDVAQSVQSYIIHMLTSAAPGQSEESPDLAQARQDLYREQTRRLRLENDARESQLVEADLVEGFLAHVAVTFGAQLDALGGRLAGQLEGACSCRAAEIRARIFAECRRIRGATAGELERYAGDLLQKVGVKP
jgi:hypothetical protein